MPVRRNVYYNPEIGQAIASLGQAFAPPSGQDLAGYATAGAKKQEAERLAWLFGNPNDPTASARAALTGVQGYGQTPAGFGMTDATNRYKITTDATTDIVKQKLAGENALAVERAKGVTTGRDSMTSFSDEEAAIRKMPRTIYGPQELRPGSKIVLADGRVLEGGPQPEGETELAKTLRERNKLPPGHPDIPSYEARAAALGRGQQQSAYDKKNDEDFAQLGSELFANATKAIGDRDTYTLLEAAASNPDVTQGPLGGASLAVKKTLNAFGVDAGATAPAEALNALGNAISLRLRDPSGGAGMPGALSDSDREFLKTMTVALGNSREANVLLARYYLAAQQRALGLEDLRQQYVANNGRLNEGFRTEMSNYLRNNDPVAAVRAQMSGRVRPAAPAGAPAPAPAAAAAPPAPPHDPVPVTSVEEARKLPRGTRLLLPDGTEGRVP